MMGKTKTINITVICLILSSTMYLYIEWMDCAPAINNSTYSNNRNYNDMTPGMQHDPEEETPDPSHRTSGKVNDVIRILSWTMRLSFKKSWWAKGEESFSECGLPAHMRCHYTDDPHEYNTSDVILFRLRYLKNGIYLPRDRHAHQKWVFVAFEPPTKAWWYNPRLNLDAIRGIFNLTSTYTQDSSIPDPLPLRCSRDQVLYRQLEGVDFASGKTRNVAWFVSHCPTPSKREEYVSILKQFIDVDVYGRCGNLSCVDQKSPWWADAEQDMSDCDTMLLNHTYRFYLSFENSLCEEYVTEKLRRLLAKPINTIPIVLGLNNYSDILPTDSHINVRDFSHPRQLASYLKHIAKNAELYNEFIRNKNSLTCPRPRSQSYQCRLCRYLHEHRHERQTVNDVVKYWSVDNKCVSLQQFLQL